MSDYGKRFAPPVLVFLLAAPSMSGHAADEADAMATVERTRVTVGGETVRRTTITLTADSCRRLVRYRQPDGVEYEPGVDVDGDPVAPAELGGGVQLDFPETVTIPIELDVLSGRRHGRDEPEPGTPAGDDPDDVPDDADLGDRLIGDAQIGTVEVDVATGRATFNGQPLRSQTQRRLDEKCQEILREGRRQ